ncbi:MULTISPECIES: hypothetical protein [unclassified Paenibacillus]|uniref:hypothetical protein n=1 Tax=unclassified Paenibacillus TaxID=185978 RepID=UPI002F3FE185
MDNNYKFTELDQSLVEDIRSLEKKIEETIGEKVNLIAYSPAAGEKDNTPS